MTRLEINLIFFNLFLRFCFEVYPDGRVCISILHPPGEDPTGYESSSERWSPVQSIEKILISVVSVRHSFFFTKIDISETFIISSIIRGKKADLRSKWR
jgi:hypothetical protein